jgi:hypothetical protein
MFMSLKSLLRRMLVLESIPTSKLQKSQLEIK